MLSSSAVPAARVDEEHCVKTHFLSFPQVPITEDDSALSVGYAAAMDAALQEAHSPSGAPNHHGASTHQETEETTPSDVSERPSVDDAESETGSTGALETRSLKDHKGMNFFGMHFWCIHHKMYFYVFLFMCVNVLF